MEQQIAFTYRTFTCINMFVNARLTYVHCLNIALHNAQYNTLHFTMMYPIHPIKFNFIKIPYLLTKQTVSFHITFSQHSYKNSIFVLFKDLLYCNESLHNMVLYRSCNDSNLMCNVGCTFLTYFFPIVMANKRDFSASTLQIFTGRICRGAIQLCVIGLTIGCFILSYVHRCFKGPGVSWYFCDDCFLCILSSDLFTHLLSQIKHSFIYSGRHDSEDA